MNLKQALLGLHQEAISIYDWQGEFVEITDLIGELGLDNKIDEIESYKVTGISIDIEDLDHAIIFVRRK